jgi:hypothetical protein
MSWNWLQQRWRNAKSVVRNSRLWWSLKEPCRWGGSVSVKGKSIGQAEQLAEWVRPSPPDCDAILTAQDLGINFGDWMSDAFPT